MISKIHIQALKSIQNLEVRCSRLNLVVGTNSSGKSTFLQALLLDAQNGIDEYGLNGPMIALGDYREVRNYTMSKSDIKIELFEDGKKKPASVIFRESDDNKCEVSVSGDIKDDGILLLLDDIEPDPNLATHLSYESGFHYLSCHRLGVRDIYQKNLRNEDDFGIEGEYALSYLLKNQEKPVEDELKINNVEITSSLIDQVNYWLHYIVGTTIKLNDLKKTNYFQVVYNNNISNQNSETLFCRPINVGSGISYLISILIMCIASQEDDVLVIENPEIHLHPKAQSRLCEFLYFISLKNRQLFVETHSDHIFNGIRVGVATDKMDSNNIAVNFFSLDNNYATQCNPIQFGEFGKIIGLNNNMDLNDLFDQFDIDLDRMLGI